jgi:phage terminase large subunit GpA-like protein
MNFVRPRARRGWFAAKGSKDSGRPLITRASRVDFTWRGATIKGGAEQWPVGVVAGKEWLFSRLTADRERLPEDRVVQFPADLGEDFYSQLTAEVYDSTKRRFVAIRPRNEALDTMVLAIAAAAHPRIRINAWREPRWQERERIYEPPHGDLFSGAPAEASAPASAPPVDDKPAVLTPPPRRGGFVNAWKR